MAADSIGVTPSDNGEFLVGRVAVTPVLFESNGEIDPETQDWSAEEIAETLDKVAEGLQWWTDTLDSLGTVHTLEFVIDDTFATTPVETPYEPIDRSTSALNLYVGDFLTDQGYGDEGTVEGAVSALNHDQRIKHDADWAFTIFIADSSDDPDGLFASGGNFAAAFAFPGGLFFVSPSTRPASTFTHEMGHIFWARDEYPGAGSWTDRRGYYDAQNLNASDNPTPGFVQEISIMRGGVPLTAAYEANVSPASTLAMIGWRDSDGDGIFDFADVPLELDGIGNFDSESSTYRFVGTASAVPLRNQNSSGNQSDITLNEVSRLQYRLDGDDWLTAAEIGLQTADLDVEFAIADSFETIELRVIDDAIGVTSEIVSGTFPLAAVSGSSVSGIAFLDQDGDGQRSLDEPLLVDHSVTLKQADGSPLYQSDIAAADFPDDVELPGDAAVGISLSADGLVSDPNIGVFASEALSERAFHTFNLQRERWSERFNDRVALVADFHSPTGQVTIDFASLDAGSYARIEGIDGDGNEVARITSDWITGGEASTLTLTDPLGRIEQIRIFGHADTSIAVHEIVAGVSGQLQTDALGVWQLDHLPVGDYQLEVTPQVIIHSFADVPTTITVSEQSGPALVAAATRINSPRYNASIAEDVNEDGSVTSLDALLIINDMSRANSRVLGMDETEGFAIDVNNDGSVTALDALLVINAIGRADGGGEAESLPSGESANSTTPVLGGLQMTDGPQNAAAANDLVLVDWNADWSETVDLAGGGTPDESAGRIATDTNLMSKPSPRTASGFDQASTNPPRNWGEMLTESPNDPAARLKTTSSDVDVSAGVTSPFRGTFPEAVGLKASHGEAETG